MATYVAMPDPAALAGFAGSYHSDETDMHHTVRLLHGALRLSWPRRYDIELTPPAATVLPAASATSRLFLELATKQPT